MNLSPTTHVLARAIILHKNHILLCRTVGLDPNNIYFTPGGHIEPSETAKQALHRELLEEIRFNFTVKRFLGCIEYFFQTNEITPMHCHNREYNFFFEATAKEIELQISIPKLEQHIDLIWVPMKDFLSIDIKPEALKQFINLWLNQNANHMFIPYEC